MSPAPSVTPTASSSSPATSASPSPSHHLRVVCYYTSWAQYRSGQATYVPEDIDPALCTEIVYAFASFSSSTLDISTYEWNDAGGKNMPPLCKVCLYVCLCL